jgi:predicted metal-dependent hydrolase
MDEEKPCPTPADCHGRLHPEALAGLRLFNQGCYWEAHEALETAWRDEPGQIRHLYRGVLQVGVAYYHISKRNYTGALKLFRRSHRWLTPFSGICRGIDVDRVKADFEAAIQELQRLGPDRIEEFDTRLLNPVIFSESSETS